MSLPIIAMDEPKVEGPLSEASFQFFVTDDGTPGKLHDRSYTEQEIYIIEQYLEKLSAPRSREKDEIIARALISNIKFLHHQSNLDAAANCYFWIPNSSFPKGANLKSIARHGIDGRKFLCFGRNRTFDILKERLRWIDGNNQPTALCPSVFREIWQEALENRR
jgi:hypothetical protein